MTKGHVRFRGIEEGRLQPLVRYRQGRVRTSHRGLALDIIVRPKTTVTDMMSMCIPPQHEELQIPIAGTKGTKPLVLAVAYWVSFTEGDGVGVSTLEL